MTDATSPAPNATSTHPRKGLRTLVRRSLGVLIAGSLVGLGAYAMRPRPIACDTGHVTRGVLRVTVDEDGRSRVKDRYVVSAPLGGNVARLELHPGDAIHAGDVVARIVPLTPPLLDARSRAEAEARVAAALAQERQARASTERARASVAFAQREAERQTTLGQRGASAAQQVEQAQMQSQTAHQELTSLEFGVRVASYEVQVARAALGRLTAHAEAEGDEQLEVTAPVDGRVLRVLQESAGPIAAGTDLIELGDPAALEIVVDVLTSDAVRIHPGARVSVERWGGAPVTGHVRLVEPAAFTRVSSLGVEEQRVNVIIDLDPPHEAWAALGDGYRVEAHIIVTEVENALLVPASAVFRHGDGWAVFVLREGHAVITDIEAGERDGISVEVRSGLEEGAIVLVHPSEHVTDGTAVEARAGS